MSPPTTPEKQRQRTPEGNTMQPAQSPASPGVAMAPLTTATTTEVAVETTTATAATPRPPTTPTMGAAVTMAPVTPRTPYRETGFRFVDSSPEPEEAEETGAQPMRMNAPIDSDHKRFIKNHPEITFRA